MEPRRKGQSVQDMHMGGAPLSWKTTVAQDPARLLEAPNTD